MDTPSEFFSLFTFTDDYSFSDNAHVYIGCKLLQPVEALGVGTEVEEILVNVVTGKVKIIHDGHVYIVTAKATFGDRVVVKDENASDSDFDDVSSDDDDSDDSDEDDSDSEDGKGDDINTDEDV
jgi:hypothetical protein